MSSRRGPRRLLRIVRCAAIGWTIGSSIGAAAADDSAAGVIERLRRTGEATCTPVWPMFCSNVHVSCAGHTPIPAFEFRLRVASSEGSIVPATAVPATPEAVYAPYAKARIEWDDAGAAVILRPAEGMGYVRLQADGRYSFRHYVGAAGVMSIGHCR